MKLSTTLRGNAVIVQFLWHQDDATASNVYVDEDITPSLNTLEHFILTAHHHGLKVILKPLVVGAHDHAKMTKIDPRNEHAWFESYTARMLEVAKLAQSRQVHALSIGSDLHQLIDHNSEWRTLANDVRAVYQGLLTYCTTPNYLDKVCHIFDAVGLICP